MGVGNVPGDIVALIQALQHLNDTLKSLSPNAVVAVVLKDSIGMLIRMWTGFVLTTTDVETGGDFTKNATIQRFEPAMQVVADSALVLAVAWASYRIMWGHGIRTQYTARVLLPRVFMAALLVNFAMPMFQAAVGASNVMSGAVYGFGNIPDWKSWLAAFSVNPSDALWQVLVTGVLVVAYDVLAVAYLVRYTILVFLAITAPLAAVMFVVPDTMHIARLWRQWFVTNLLMQPIQLFVLSIGFALDHPGITPVRHLFALASLLIVFKVPGAMGSAEKVAHKLASTAHTGLTHVEHHLVRA
jgi:hypothetical protein